MFGMGPVASSMFADDPFFAQPPAMLARMELPTMRVAVDVEENDKAFVIKADTPGIPKDALKLSVMDGTLTISGERQEEKQVGGPTAEGAEGASSTEGQGAASKAPQSLRYERSYGSFSRSFSLPPNVDVEGIQAEAQDGVLTVTIPKVLKVNPQPKEIEIK
jgi:HSP20 family protein